MRLATVRCTSSPDEGTEVVRLDGDTAVAVDLPDVGAALSAIDAGTLTWAELAAMSGPELALDELDFAPLVTRPGKIACVGLNYRSHILEMGRELPASPTWFSKFAEAIIGANDDIHLDPIEEHWDWEAELAIVVGSTVRAADAERARAAIAGHTVANDLSARQFQNRTTQWMAGKTFEHTTPIGPWLVTPDEAWPGDGLEITCRLDDVVVQRANTSDLVFDPVACIMDLSAIVTLRPGDIILTGTPGGVGAGRTPPQWLRPGVRLHTEIEGLGRLVNRCV